MNLTEYFNIFIIELFKVTGSLGWSIVALTLILRSLLIPLTLPSIKAQHKMRELQPEINKLKKSHGHDKKALQQKQLELYQKYNVNPLAGCLPQLLQIGVLILLYRSLVSFLGDTNGHGLQISSQFLWLDLAKPDPKYILPVLAGVTQFILSLMLAPATQTPDIIPNKSKSKKLQEANKKEEDTAEMAASISQQMIFIMPLMTAFISLRFPSGLALYWVVSTVFSVVQQYFISGPGGLTLYLKRITSKFNK